MSLRTCDVCDGEEFDCFDGLYFCKDCNSQSQGLQTEVDADDIFVAGQYTRSYGKAKSDQEQTTNKNGKNKPAEDLGRPWTTTELFTMILKEQLKALIKLGADAKLEEIVHRIWILYVQKCGLAFFEKSIEDPVDPLKPFVRERDKFLCKIAYPRRRPIRRNATMLVRKATYSFPKRLQTQIDMREAIGDQEFYEGDNPIGKDDESAYELQLVEAQMGERQKREERACDEVQEQEHYDDERRREIEDGNVTQHRMSLSRTLSILFLGLQYTNNQVLSHDIVRWIKQGVLPFFNSVDLPSDMKLSYNDSSVFDVAMPTPHTVTRDAASVVEFLKLKKFPRVNILLTCSRFMAELGLPAELHTVVKNLFEIKSPNRRPYCYTLAANLQTDFSVLSMAYVVIAVKMVFGLDDNRELETSKTARQLMNFVTFDPPLFVWEDWTKIIEQIRAKEASQWFPDLPSNIDKVCDLTPVMNDYERRVRKIYKVEDATKRYARPSYHQLLDRICQPLSMIYSKSMRQVKSDPVPDTEEVETDAATVPDARGSALRTKLLEFSQASIQYIINPGEFHDGLEYRSTMQRRNEDLRLTSKIVLGTRTRPHQARCKAIQKDVQRTPRNVISTRNAFKPAKSLLYGMHANKTPFYTIYPLNSQYRFNQDARRSEIPTTRHLSYSWFLQICADWIETKCELLENYVERLELVYFYDRLSEEDRQRFEFWHHDVINRVF